MDLAEVSRSGWPKIVTGAPAQKKREQESGERFFHYSGVADGAGVGNVSVVDDGGAVVVSGRSEAGGGSDMSVSGGGSGASLCISASEPGPGSVTIFLLFPLAAAAVTEGAWSALSPSLARSSEILFFARSPSRESGCCRMTSL